MLDRKPQAHINRENKLDDRKSSLVTINELISKLKSSHSGNLSAGEKKYIQSLRRQQWGLQFNISVTETISKLYN